LASIRNCWGIGQKPFTLEMVGVAEFMKMFVKMPKSGKLCFEARECSWKMSWWIPRKLLTF
jgi:type III secretory pathway component EscR